MVDLDKVRDITLEPGKRLVILVMNADQYSPHGPLWITPRAPVDQYLGMHVTRNCAQHSYAGHGRRLHDQTPNWCTAELGRLPDRHGAWAVNEVGLRVPQRMGAASFYLFPR